MVRVRIDGVITDDDTGEALRTIRLAARDGIGMCDLVEVGDAERRRPVRRFAGCDDDRGRSYAFRIENGSDFVITSRVVILNDNHCNLFWVALNVQDVLGSLNRSTC